MKSRLIASILLFLAAVNGIAQQEKKAYSLKEAQQYALEHAYSLKSAELDIEASKKKVAETTAIGLPQISGSGSFQQFIDIPTQVLPNFINDALPPGSPKGPDFIEAQFGTKYNVSGGLSASQLLLDGSYFIGLQAAKTYMLFSKVQKQKVEADIKATVAQAYYTALIAAENLSVLRKSKAETDKMYIETKALYDNGFVDETDLDQIKLLVKSQENQIAFAEKQVAVTKKLLNFQMGLAIENEIELSDNLESVLPTTDAESILSKDLKVTEHADYQVINTSVALQKLNVSANKAGYYPSLSAFASYQRQALRNEFNLFDANQLWFPATVVGLNLRVPIFTSFGQKYRVDQAKIELEKTELMKFQVEESLKLQLENARSEYFFALNQYQNEKENLVLAEKINQRTLAKYKQGVAGSFELNQANVQYIQKQGTYIAAMLQLLTAKTNLDKALNNN